MYVDIYAPRLGHRHRSHRGCWRACRTGEQRQPAPRPRSHTAVFQQLWRMAEAVLHRQRQTMVTMLLATLLLPLALVHARPHTITDINIAQLEDKQAGGDGGGTTVGGGLDTLISDMFKRIIERRLQNLLQGVTSPDRKDLHLLESSESLYSNEELNTNAAFEEGEEFLEISLPIAVTEIPQEVFTSLPGTLFGSFWSNSISHYILSRKIESKN